MNTISNISASYQGLTQAIRHAAIEHQGKF